MRAAGVSSPPTGALRCLWGNPPHRDPFSHDVGREELESEALLTEVARKASEWLGVLMEVSQGAEGQPKASTV